MTSKILGTGEMRYNRAHTGSGVPGFPQGFLTVKTAPLTITSDWSSVRSPYKNKIPMKSTISILNRVKQMCVVEGLYF